MTTHLTWPPERFYWALVPAAPWKGTGPLPAGLLALTEDDLPVDTASIHAVGIPVEAGVIVCAVPRESLESLDDSVLSLTPVESPPGIVANCSGLNLLVGEFEPRPIRQARLGRHALAAGTLLLCSLLLAAGLSRRTAQWSDMAAANEQACMAAATTVLPDAQPATVLLDLRRRAIQTNQASVVRPTPDAALALTDLLEHWPAQVASQPQSITIRGEMVSVSVLVGDAPAFLAAMHPPPGWTMDQPMLNTSGNQTRLSLTFQTVRAAAELAAKESNE